MIFHTFLLDKEYSKRLRLNNEILLKRFDEFPIDELVKYVQVRSEALIQNFGAVNPYTFAFYKLKIAVVDSSLEGFVFNSSTYQEIIVNRVADLIPTIILFLSQTESSFENFLKAVYSFIYNNDIPNDYISKIEEYLDSDKYISMAKSPRKIDDLMHHIDRLSYQLHSDENDLWVSISGFYSVMKDKEKEILKQVKEVFVEVFIYLLNKGKNRLLDDNKMGLFRQILYRTIFLHGYKTKAALTAMEKDKQDIDEFNTEPWDPFI